MDKKRLVFFINKKQGNGIKKIINENEYYNKTVLVKRITDLIIKDYKRYKQTHEENRFINENLINKSEKINIDIDSKKKEILNEIKDELGISIQDIMNETFNTLIKDYNDQRNVKLYIKKLFNR